ncbi:MAG: trigger factor [Lachnospiraceae bacterium]|nr:trigger factor [Lachnospiraceae bacterium]
MKKRLAYLVTAMLILSLTGCGGAGGAASTSGNAGAAAQSENVTMDTADLGKLVRLGQYKGLEISVNSAKVTQEDIDAQIETALSSEAEQIEVTNRAVKDGDIVNIDYEGKKDGVAFDGGTAQGYDLAIGSGTFIEGFEEGLIGAKLGETRDLNLTFPENYGAQELAGQDVVFTVKVNSIKEEKLPELTDELAQKINPDVKTVDEFKAYIKDSLEKAAIDASRNAAYSQLLNMVDASSEIVSGNDIPAGILNEVIEAEKSSFESMMQAYGMDINTYLSSQGLTEEQYNEQIKVYSESVARQKLLVRALAQAEKIEVSDADLSEQYENYAQEYGYSSAEEFKSAVEGQQGVDTFKEAVLTRKVEEMLFDNATITNPEEVIW